MMSNRLELNDHIFGKPREVVFLAIAVVLHIPIFFWKGRPYTGPQGDPIIGVDFVIEEDTPSETTPPPPPVEKEKKVTFYEKVQKMVGLAAKPASVEKIGPTGPAKDELSGMGDSGKIAVAKKVESILGGDTLTSKTRGLSGTLSVNNIKSETGLVSGGVGAAPIATPGGGTLKSKSTAFRLGSKDVPFAVKRAPEGDLPAGLEDAPRIAVASRGDRGTKSVSTAFFGSGGGTGGGTGSGDGAGGGTLKDKGGAGSGLSGVSGGFSGLGDGDGLSGGGRQGGSLSGVSVGGGGGGGGGTGSRSPYEITGPLSGRRILSQVLPPYPDWAREQGLIATVSVAFFVRHTGEVNESNMTVKRTSGHVRLDNAAMEALKKWRFEPLPESQYGREQWGIITFKFRAT